MVSLLNEPLFHLRDEVKLIFNDELALGLLSEHLRSSLGFEASDSVSTVAVLELLGKI